MRKISYVIEKSKLYGFYPPPFIKAIGENLPFKDNIFDAMFSYQTLEHVHDVRRVLKECLRVIKPGGILYIQAPDYLGFYEGHYKIFWLPLLPRKLAKIYLWARKLRLDYIDTVIYTTNGMVTRYLKEHDVEIYDQRMLYFHTIFNRDIKTLDKIRSSKKRILFKGAVYLKLTWPLKVIAKLLYRMTNRFISITVIKKPHSLNCSEMQLIRTF